MLKRCYSVYRCFTAVYRCFTSVHPCIHPCIHRHRHRKTPLLPHLLHRFYRLKRPESTVLHRLRCFTPFTLIYAQGVPCYRARCRFTLKTTLPPRFYRSFSFPVRELEIAPLKPCARSMQYYRNRVIPVRQPTRKRRLCYYATSRALPIPRGAR